MDPRATTLPDRERTQRPGPTTGCQTGGQGESVGRGGGPVARVAIPARGPFSLAAASRFLAGFEPAAHEGAGPGGHLHLALTVEGGWSAVGVCVTGTADGVAADLYGAGGSGPDADGVDVPGVRAQVARILSLDVDGRGFPAVGARDTVIGWLQNRHPGLRPVCFPSPYEAACWAIVSHRVRMSRAATIKQRIAQRHGPTVDIHGDHRAVFPPPAVLRRLAGRLDLWAVKRQRLAGIAAAALDGRLAAADLRAAPAADALRRLQELAGIGPFSAELVLLRGAGHPDRLPRHERRLREAMARLYELDDPSTGELRGIADSWRPYRTWCAVLIRSWFEQVR